MNTKGFKMSIEIKKFGKIKEALIETNGLTVIAGHNDTGKSTIGKLLSPFYKPHAYL